MPLVHYRKKVAKCLKSLYVMMKKSFVIRLSVC